MEVVVQGVSTRRVSAITEELCGVSFRKSTVSSLCDGLDARVRAFNERPLEGEYPFVLVDAMFIQSRQDDHVRIRTVLMVSGVRSDGYREILGARIGDSKSFATWDETFRWLRGRGLKGVSLRDFGPAQGFAGSHRQTLPQRDLAALSGASDAQYPGILVLWIEGSCGGGGRRQTGIPGHRSAGGTTEPGGIR